ncbi:MAG: S8 family serine peptidase, partial [Planctomycetota bacterium]
MRKNRHQRLDTAFSPLDAGSKLPETKGPIAKLLGAKPTGSARQQPTKSWVFEQLEDRHMMSADFVPNDPYFSFQWPLLNTGGVNIGDQRLQDVRGVAGEDINVIPAWQFFLEDDQGNTLIDGLSGAGIQIAVVSTGIQTDHPDLVANISDTLAYDAVSRQDLFSTPNAGSAALGIAADARGTAIAGLIGAAANDEGIVGVAYESEIVPVRLLSGADASVEGLNPEIIADLFRWENQQVDIYTHAWGDANGANTILTPTPQELDALRESVLLGRGGLGVIHVFEAGDGAGASIGLFSDPTFNAGDDFAGYNGYLNSRYTIGVTSVDHDGEVANVDGTVTRYGEISPAILVAAPSGSVSGFGLIDDPSVGSGVWTTDFFVDDPSDPTTLFQQGFNAPTTEDLFEPDDLILDPFTGLTINDRFEDTAYTSRFSGTGASAALVSGVIALMLEADIAANGEATLSYRDVQEILVRSARQNAPFESLQTGSDRSSGFEHPETWITNRNEPYHEPDVYNAQNVDQFDDDGNQINFGIFQADALAHVYFPIIDPSETSETSWSPVSLFTNGAGYTVSQGNAELGTAVGYGHGVIDAELAVSLAAQWNSAGQTLAEEQSWTTFPQFSGGIPARSVSNDDTQRLVVPGGLGGQGGINAYINEYATDSPFENYTGPRQNGVAVVLDVPEDRTVSTEWVEVKLDLSTGDIDNLRITLISPDGVHSELNHSFQFIEPTQRVQYQGDVVNSSTGGEFEDRGGSGPGGPFDQDGGNVFYTFSTNRHWGERTDSRIAIDPSTGNPYAGSVAPGDFGATVPSATFHDWHLVFENYGDTP